MGSIAAEVRDIRGWRRHVGFACLRKIGTRLLADMPTAHVCATRCLCVTAQERYKSRGTYSHEIKMLGPEEIS